MNARSSDVLVGSEFAGYRVEAFIGRGGMGAVYRAVEEGLGRKVALKVIATELAGDGRFRERFLRESRIAASLDHPHVVPIFAAGEVDGALFLAMRYVEGTDLGRLLREHGALDAAFVIPLLEQVAEALDAAHERGLVHRDVKPSNILVASSGGREHCYLGDFGLTKRTGSLSGVSATGEVVGTLDYVAPEQITGGEVGAAADLYSLACVLYECLTGQSPFPRATDVALLWAHVHDEPERASAVRPELPRALDAVLARGLAKEPERRYTSAGELIADAKAALGLVPARPPVRRRALPAIVVSALAAGVLAVALWFVLERGDTGLTSVAPNSVGVIDAATNELVAEVPVGIDPGAVTVGAGAVWVANQRDETVTRIDPRTRQYVRTISVGDSPAALTVGGGAVWVALGSLAELTRIDPEQNEAAARAFAALGEGVPCGTPGAGVAFGGGFAWFLCESGELGRVDPKSGKAVRVTELVTSSSAINPDYSDIAFAFGSLWVLNRTANQLVEVDPITSLRLDPITVGDGPSALAVGRDALWVANGRDGTVTRVELGEPGQAAQLQTIRVTAGLVDVAVGAGGVWVASSVDRTVTRIDEKTGEPTAVIELGNEPQEVVASEGSVWVTVRTPDERMGP